MKTLLFFLVASFPVFAQTVDYAAWEKSAIAEMKRTNIPGAVAGVVRDGKLVYAKGLGVASVETGEPVRPDHLFRLGSTTKMMTATALAILAAQGRLDLHAPSGRYVAGLPPALAALTIHQLLSHTAGLKDAASMAGSHDDEALARYIATWDASWLFTTPGRVMSYSNPGYHLAGRVLESVTGKAYATAMDEVLFQPLGMKRTTLRPLTAMTYPLAQGHSFDFKVDRHAVIRPAADDASQWPAGSVFTNADDWARFVTALLQRGIVEGKRAWPEGVTERLTQEHAKPPQDPESAYGYGIAIARKRGVLVWQHGGARAGYGSLLLMAPERGVAVFAICNSTGASLGESVRGLMDSLLGLPRESRTQPPAGRAMPSGVAGKITGAYRNGDAVIIVRKDGAGVSVRLSGREYPAAWRDPAQLVLEKGPALTVVFDEKGQGEFLCSGLRCSARTADPVTVP